MNMIVMISLVLIIVIAIYLATSYIGLNYLIRDATVLNIGSGTTGSTKTTDATMKIISSGELDSPSSTRYYYSGWFFIDTNFTIKDRENVLFNRGTDFLVSLEGSTLNIYAGAENVPSLSASDLQVGTLSKGDKAPLITVPNVPFQRWMFLVINVDGIVVDVYIDGKFAVSKTSNMPIGSNGSTPITYGNQYTQGSVARFSRPATNISPQGVWSLFMQGSGQNKSILSSKAGIKMQLLKNGQVKVDQRLL